MTFFRPLWGAKIRASPIDGVWVYGVFPGLLLTPRFNEEIETQRRLEPFLTVYTGVLLGWRAAETKTVVNG